MRNGSIALPSGGWHWTILRQWTGSTVLYQHRERIYDEMRNWTPEQELTEAQAEELAKDPLERVWVDVDGLRWRLSIELPSTWLTEARRSGGKDDEGSLWLVFRRGGTRRMVEVPATAHLGEFSHNQLIKLLERAFSSGAGLQG
jgi:hypothetical protein